MNHLEKRKAPRITTVVPVTCRVTTAAVAALPSARGAEQHRGTTFSARTVNISHDGILINSDTDLMPLTQLEMTMQAPSDGHAIRILAEVAWSRKNAMNLFGRYGAGLKVKQIDPKDEKLLTNFFKPA
jgi:hypothetical protein